MKQIEIYQCYVDQNHPATYQFWFNSLENQKVFFTKSLSTGYTIRTVNSNRTRFKFHLILEKE